MRLRGVRDKVDEATFFLGHMRSEGNNWRQEDPNIFRYYLSAFLNACYSSRAQVKKHFIATLRQSKVAQGKRANSRFLAAEKEWEKVLSPANSEDSDLWGFIGDLRGDEVHDQRTPTVVKEKKIPMGYGEGIPPGYSYFSPPPVQFAAASQARLQGWSQAWHVAAEHHFTIRDQVMPVIGVCERYLDILRRFVAHFEDYCETDIKSSGGGDDGTTR